ncbi:MAG: energy-coupling factor ABC transporter ATP-binding protein [Agathobacter sp.]|nr:energy-coupling factor ABC transporter ATP-binding protein [Agathobacter sp.]
MIKFENVSFGYEKEIPVIKNLSFSIKDGDTIGLIGANGTGKSTIMKILLGLLQHEGHIIVDSLEVEKKNYPEIRKKLGYVLQDSDNQMFMPTVYEDMMFAPMNYGFTRDEAEKRVDETLKKLGLMELKHRHNHKISGGEKRMAAIATILAMDPEVILMDEPSTALDPMNRRTLINTIKQLPQTKIIASHDLDMILETCNRVILLNHGEIVADGKTKELLTNRKLLEANRMELPLCLQHTVPDNE